MRNKEFHSLYMDFKKFRDNGMFPGDIDMFYTCGDKSIVIGETKLKGSYIHGLQEKALTNLVDGHKYGGILLEIEHESRVQDGATSVNVADCIVKRAYKDGKWYTPSRPINALQYLSKISENHGGMLKNDNR